MRIEGIGDLQWDLKDSVAIEIGRQPKGNLEDRLIAAAENTDLAIKEESDGHVLRLALTLEPTLRDRGIAARGTSRFNLEQGEFADEMYEHVWFYENPDGFVNQNDFVDLMTADSPRQWLEDIVYIAIRGIAQKVKAKCWSVQYRPEQGMVTITLDECKVGEDIQKPDRYLPTLALAATRYLQAALLSTPGNTEECLPIGLLTNVADGKAKLDEAQAAHVADCPYCTRTIQQAENAGELI